jgi:hypothetical protein
MTPVSGPEGAIWPGCARDDVCGEVKDPDEEEEEKEGNEATVGVEFEDEDDDDDDPSEEVDLLLCMGWK